jgi:hypothetical protein
MVQSNPQPTNSSQANAVVPSVSNTADQKIGILSNQVNQVWQMNNGLFQSLRLVHWMGYGLLLISLLNLANVLYPVQFMNPRWEFELIGQMVEAAPVLLLGFVSIFLGEKALRASWEREHPTFVEIVKWQAVH